MLGDIYFVVSYFNQKVFGQFDNYVSLLELGRIHYSQTQIFKLNLKEACIGEKKKKKQHERSSISSLFGLYL